MKNQFAIIGLGRFGSSVGTTLYSLGLDVMAVDVNDARVQAILPMVSHAVRADSTDEEAMKALGLHKFDTVVVAIGQDIQSSILTTLIVKDIGVKNLVVKAQNDLHGKVLQKIGADLVVYPERDMGQRVAHRLMAPNILDVIELSGDYRIAEIAVLPKMVGRNLAQLAIRAKYGCNVIAIKSDQTMNVAPRADDIIQANDILVVIGKDDELSKFERSFQ